MSARARVHAMLPPLDNPAEADARAQELDARLDALRIEHLNEGITRLGQWTVSDELKPGVGFAIGVLLSLRDNEPAEPTFFQPGHTYRHSGWTFRVVALAPHPDTGVLHAVGWMTHAGITIVGRLDGRDWESGKWADTASEVTA